MRITSEVLQRLADDFIQRRLRIDRDILAVYLHGSVLSGEPALGGTADIDLFFIHVNPVLAKREIERITDDIHLDIAHYERNEYNRTRQIRVHPWMGPVVNSCRILYDPQHFLNFVQAGVRSQFDRPENVLRRAQSHLERARQIWLEYQQQLPEAGPERFSRYLDAVNSAAQAVTLLNGLPLTERRLLAQFTQSAQAVNEPGMQAGLTGLLGGANLSVERLQAWLPEWQETYLLLPAEKAPVRLRPQRLNYYRRAYEQFISEGQEKLVLWPLLRTWTDLVLELRETPSKDKALSSWQEVTTQLELTGEAFEVRLAALDVFLDRVEETLEVWGQARGV
jgi:predicted nucleotidyltransferase